MHEKNPSIIKQMFNNVARKYDILNDILSFGIHRLWLKKAVRVISPSPNSIILDLATGTGNFAFEFVKFREDLKVIGLDFSENMLEIARRRLRKSFYNVEFQLGDALNIPFFDSTFDIVSMSYGIRNVASIGKCLTEIARVLNPDGKFVIVEFGRPNKYFRPIYKILQNFMLIPFGGFISKNKEAYEYLFYSSERFPSGRAFKEIIEETNLFVNVNFEVLTFGIAYIYTGKVKK